LSQSQTAAIAAYHLIGGHVGKEEAEDLPGVEVLGNVDCAGLRYADAVRVGAPYGQRTDAITHAQPRALRTELFDDTDELVAGRERWLRRAREVRAGAQLGIGERHPGCQNLDAHLARTRSRIVLLHHPQDLGPAEVVDDYALHRPHLLAGAASRPAAAAIESCLCGWLISRWGCAWRPRTVPMPNGNVDPRPLAAASGLDLPRRDIRS
jgi:hypothetical protein